jgi:hypothetical protein
MTTLLDLTLLQTTATNKPASGNNANCSTFTTNHGSQYGKQMPLLIMTTYILED